MFPGYNLATLPVTYYANRKAWVTGDLFNLINNQMKRQNRDILLFIDNCATHPDVTLSNVKLRFLPPNTTSCLQPLEAGIIKATKSVYRKQPIRYILFHTEEVLVLRARGDTEDRQETDEEDTPEEHTPEPPKVSSKEASTCLDTLKNFVLQHQNPELLEQLYQCQAIIDETRLKVAASASQKTMKEFFMQM